MPYKSIEEIAITGVKERALLIELLYENLPPLKLS